MYEYIPLEIQVEIIKRLPIKSLIQFRSVSKPWKSLIDSSKFIAAYSNHHTQPQRLLVRYDDYDDDPLNKYFSIVDDDTFFQSKYDDLDIPLFVNILHNSRIVGSSQGLLCFYGDIKLSSSWIEPKKITVIWNPAVRKSVVISVPNVLEYTGGTVVGFGVCPNTSDPKLVKCSYINKFSEIDGTYSLIGQVEVFTLSSGAWRDPLFSSTNLPRLSVQFTWSQVVIEDGFIYWFVYELVDEIRTYNMIYSFDLISEEFREIYLPDSLAHRPPSDLSISKLRESLVVLEYGINNERQVCDVWEMVHGDGVQKSFRKLYTINPPDESIKNVLGFRKNGAPIVQVEEDDDDYEDDWIMVAIAIYEPESKHIRKIGIYGIEDSVFLTSYIETLLLLTMPDDCSILGFKKRASGAVEATEKIPHVV